MSGGVGYGKHRGRAVRNQLQSVSGGYVRAYSYNANGSMVSDGSITISYNELELPKIITGTEAGNTVNDSYLYDASGDKLTKLTTTDKRNYISGIEYDSTSANHANVIDIIHNIAGVARNSGGTYSYEFFLTDHLGNTRVVFNQAGDSLQHTDYYPFGLQIARYDAGINNNYKYNGKELQPETGQYDYGARFYDPTIARWMVSDPLASKMPTISPYAFCFDNPIKFFDHDGQIPYPITIRAFAPFAEFGFGYHGDNRGYSTSSTATARVNQRINFDTDKSSITTHAWSNPTWTVSNPSYKKTATPSVKFDEPFTISNNGDAKTFKFGSHVAAGNPETPKALTPNIDVFSDFSITANKKAGTLTVSGKLTGDNFPSTEVFITDPNGNNVFIGVGQIAAGVGKNTGPFTELPGENKDNPITSFNFTITTDKDGNFTGVQVGKTNYSIKDWNKQFLNTQPQKQQ